MDTKIILCFFVALIITGCATTTDIAYETEWRCVEAECMEFMDGETWIQTFCLQDGNRTVCPIQVDEQQFLIPLEELRQQIDFTQFRECMRARCTAEMQVRLVDYELDFDETLDPEQVN